MWSGEGARRRAGPEIRASVTDLDGTLLRSDGTLSRPTRGVLRAARRGGFPVVIATARTPRAIRRIADYRDLGVVVCANGAIVWDSTSDEVIEDRCFDPAALTEALARLRSVLPNAGLAVLSAERMCIDVAYREQRRTGAQRVELVEDVAVVAGRERIAVVAVRHPGLAANEFIEAAGDAFAGIGTATFASGPTVDIHPIGTSKALACAELLAQDACSGEETVAFGDMPNDLALFAWAGWACAVENAHPDVLRAADEIVPSNDDDGVAVTLQRVNDSL